MSDVTADYLALRREVGAVERERDVVRVSGSDAATYLHGQLSQDVTGLATGGSALSFLLQPQGKVDALVRVTRLADDDFVLDVDGGWGPAVLERLRRFTLRTAVELAPVGWRVVGLVGPAAPEVAPALGDAAAVAAGDAIAVDAGWPGLPAIDLIGPDPQAPAGVRHCGPDAYESVRIEAGIPRLGAEVDESTIPQELGADLVDRSVSFTKGCYTGQELVARIDSRGHVNRRLRGIVVAATVRPPVGAEVWIEGRDTPAGVLTSVGESLDRRATVALALVRREVEPPAAVTLRWEGGEAAARCEELPMVGADR